MDNSNDIVCIRSNKVYPLKNNTKENKNNSYEKNINVSVGNKTTERRKDLTENDGNESMPY